MKIRNGEKAVCLNALYTGLGFSDGASCLLRVLGLHRLFLFYFFYLSFMALPCPGSDLPIHRASPFLLFYTLSVLWLVISKKPLYEVFKYFSSNTGFAPRILPQAVARDLDSPFLSPHNEMALIQKHAHSHV